MNHYFNPVSLKIGENVINYIYDAVAECGCNRILLLLIDNKYVNNYINDAISKLNGYVLKRLLLDQIILIFRNYIGLLRRPITLNMG